MDVPICQICKDPIWSFICIDCLATDIGDWLPSKLKSGFSEFNRNFRKLFGNGNPVFLNCVHCKAIREAGVCPFCYIVEAYHWLEKRDQKKANQLIKMVPTQCDWKISETSGCVWKDGSFPITESENHGVEEGLCDKCGEYSDEVEFFGGEWICRHCKIEE